MFLDRQAGIGETVDLPHKEAHHIFKVLRSGQGGIIEVVDPEGSLMLAEVHGDVWRARAGILEELSGPGDRQEPRVTLYQAVPKGKHMDLVVEKATELGVERLVPLLAEHGEVRPTDDKVDRWRRLTEAAARQSLRLRVPEVSGPESLARSFESLGGGGGIMLHNESGLPALEEAVAGVAPGGGAVCLFVGPEGGWSPEELRSAGEHGVRIAQLGPYRLRAETAGVVAVARTEARLRELEAPASGVV